MPRFPDASIPGLLRASDYFGTAVFAMTGTLAAATRGMDIMGWACQILLATSSSTLHTLVS
jgi:uncharacterized membrane protein YeiH